jgi:ASC-1-like (ASCH) protein
MNMVQLTNSCVVREEAIQAVEKFCNSSVTPDALRVYIPGSKLEFFGNPAKHVLKQLQEYTTFGRVLADWRFDDGAPQPIIKSGTRTRE